MKKFTEFLTQYTEEQIKNDSESIVLKFTQLEREENPNRKELKEPLFLSQRIYSICYNTFEDFKEAYKSKCEEPFADKEIVTATFKDKFIYKALNDSKAKKIYDSLKSGFNDNILIRDNADILTYYSKKLAVIELIKFEDYLNTFTEPESKKVSKGKIENSEIENVNSNPHPKIFTDKGFELWERLFDGFEIKNNSRTDVKFIFEELMSEGYIHSTVKQVDFLNWLNEKYQMEVEKTSNHSRTNIRLKLYQSLK